MSLPLQGVAYDFYTALSDALTPDAFRANPTIAAGDFQISIDGGAYVNLATLPVVDPASSVTVKISLSAAEMTGEKISVLAIDAAGGEWQDMLITLDLPEGTVETVLDIATGDRIESNTGLRINKAGTTTAVLDKDITGSLLSPSVTLTTKDST